jgi:integrase
MTISVEEKREKRLLDEFVTLARQCFSASYPGQDFDASRWDFSHLLKSSTRRSDRSLFFVRHQVGMTKSTVLEAEPMPPYFSGVVKSVLLLHPNTLVRVRLTAFRILWESLLARFGGNGRRFRWYLLREVDVRKTEHRMRQMWVDRTVYTGISALLVDLQRLADRSIVPSFDIVPETVCPKMAHRHTLEGNESALARLPPSAVLEGLADIYAIHAVSPPDRLLADILAVLAVTGLRIDEVLTLALNCLITRTLNGRKYVGLRVSKRKSPNRAEEDHVLWLTTLQTSIIVPAIAEARKITQLPRQRALELEHNPDRFPLPGVNWSDELSSLEVAELIGFSGSTVPATISKEKLGRRRVGRKDFYSAADVERYMLQRRKELWTLQRADGTKQMLSESLFVVFGNFIGALEEGKGSRRVLRLLVEPITQQQVRAFLTGVHLKDGRVWQRSAFERFDIRDSLNGAILTMNPHQCRHWITHNAARGGMPIRDLARWQGREKIDEVFTYIHMTSSERIEWLRHKLDSGDLKGPFVDYYFSLADDIKESFLEGRLTAIHVTHMGLCVHDFTLCPCPYKLACLSGKGCHEYVFDSSDAAQRANLVQLTSRTSMALEQAEAKAATEGLHSAQSWVTEARETLSNVERILSSEPAGETSLLRPFVREATKFRPISQA